MWNFLFMYEFTGPGPHSYDSAKYRASEETIKLNDLKVPSRLEVLNQHGKWQLHPVVFREGSNLIVFLDRGRWTSLSCGSLASYGGIIEKKAEELGLTQGNRSFIRSFVRETD